MNKLRSWWEEVFNESDSKEQWWKQLKAVYAKRDVTVLRTYGYMNDWKVVQKNNCTIQQYMLHVLFFLKHENHYYVEEREYPYQFYERDGKVMEHQQREVSHTNVESSPAIELIRSNEGSNHRSYDRRKAIQYAEQWWNAYNPAFRTFDVDCTNYISQCLLAGGGWMHGQPNRERGWWYTDQSWSFSWAVAHSMRWYLSGATKSISGIEVESPEKLQPGDVICYDFEGDGRWDHTTIVVAKDAANMPLVNAHTDNSRYRYWSYEDSAAWTSNIKYTFFSIYIQ